jgi:uncharacterized membrane protein
MDSRNTKTPTQIPVMWLIIGVLATIPIVYFLAHLADSAFMDSTMANWFATMVGVLIGIPIALYLSNWQQMEQEKKQQQETQAREAQARRTRILTLIGQELRYNQDARGSPRPEATGSEKRIVSLDGLKDELWNAFSDGGELEWIRDLQLLHLISFAYHYIRRMRHLRNLYLQVAFLIDKESVRTPQTLETLVKYLMKLDTTTIEHIDRALESIEKAIQDQPTADSS